jgi:protein-S-isoprenylcysteine O-methyltransferase Ste14
MKSLLWKALFAFLVLPGLVAFAIPLLAFERPPLTSMSIPGAVIAAVGVVLLLWCVGEFYVNGKGTLAPWAPPRHLVTTGLYRFSRNPMYVGVLLILVGCAVGFRSRALSLYAVAVAIAFQLRVVSHEEPWLERTFGDTWPRYKAAVPRWFKVPLT